MIVVMINGRMFYYAGDNMLTALSVAHDCSMIGVNDSVVHLTVLPPSDSRPPHVEYTYTAVRQPESVSRLMFTRNRFMLWLI